jgi:spermidine synthase
MAMVGARLVAGMQAAAASVEEVRVDMNPWRIIDSARVPGTREKLSLCIRSGVFSMRLGGNELMNSRSPGSERALGRIACERLAGHPRPRVLIGGLGMGFTLAAALERLGPGARVIVAELVPAVLKWNRGKMAALAGSPLEDRRVTVFEGDVADLLRKNRRAYDAILLDIDNGPVSFTRRGNGWLYSPAGLAAARESLRPSGVLAVWSASPDRPFARRLREAGFQVEDLEIPVSPHLGTLHTIWIACRPT